MTRPITDLDTAFFENTTAQILDVDDILKLLARRLDDRDNLALLREIQRRLNRVKQSIFDQRQYLRDNPRR